MPLETILQDICTVKGLEFSQTSNGVPDLLTLHLTFSPVLMSSPRSLYLLFIVLWPVLLYASPMKAPAQNNEITSSNTDVPVYTLVFRGEPLSEVLRTFVQKTGLNLVYDTAILDDTPVYVTIRELPAEQALARILADTSP